MNKAEHATLYALYNLQNYYHI